MRKLFTALAVMSVLFLFTISLVFAAPPVITDTGQPAVAIKNLDQSKGTLSEILTYNVNKTSASTGTALAETNPASAATYIKGTSAAKPGTYMDLQIRMKTNTAKLLATTIYMEPRPAYLLVRSSISGAPALL